MPKIRKCEKCNKDSLTPIERKLEIYNSRISYKCSNCQHEVELVPLGSLGIQMSLYLMVTVIFWFIFIDDYQSIKSIIIFFAFMAIMPSIVFFNIIKHLKNPIIATKNDEIITSGIKMNFITKSIGWIENKGFIAGLLAPLFLIIAVLGIASLIGYINFTYFGN